MLFRSVRAEQSDDLALLYIDRYVIHHRACAVFLHQIFGAEREGVPDFHAFFRVSGRSSTLDVEERFLSGRPGFSHGLRTRKCHGEIGRLSCS